MASAVFQNVGVQLDLEVSLDGVTGEQLKSLLEDHQDEIRQLLTVSLAAALSGKLKDLEVEGSHLYFNQAADIEDVED